VAVQKVDEEEESSDDDTGNDIAKDSQDEESEDYEDYEGFAFVYSRQTGHIKQLDPTGQPINQRCILQPKTA